MYSQIMEMLGEHYKAYFRRLISSQQDFMTTHVCEDICFRFVLFYLLCFLPLFLMFFTANHWKHVSNQKRFFEDFAKANNFNPLVPTRWYNVSSKQILKTQVKNKREKKKREKRKKREYTEKIADH